MTLQKNFPYKTGDGSYNRESGKKTLAFVGVCLTLVVVLSILSLVLIIQANY
jgi:hypothetical protein